MSDHIVTTPDNVMDGLDGLLTAVTAAIRAPLSYRWDGTNVIYTFTPDLSAQEAATFADTVAAVRTHHVSLSMAEYQAIKPKLVEIRSFRTRSLATWNALTTTQREADEIAYLNDLADVIRALLRD